MELMLVARSELGSTLSRLMLFRLILGGHNSKVRFQPESSKEKTGGGFISRTQACGADSARSGTVQRQSARDEGDGVAGRRSSRPGFSEGDGEYQTPAANRFSHQE